MIKIFQQFHHWDSKKINKKIIVFKNKCQKDIEKAKKKREEEQEEIKRKEK